MKKKVELLHQLKKYLKVKIDDPRALNALLKLKVYLEYDEARVLVEALESLRWANVYKEPDDTLVLGCEYATAKEAQMIGDASPSDLGYLETVGIIRLKDDEQ